MSVSEKIARISLLSKFGIYLASCFTSRALNSSAMLIAAIYRSCRWYSIHFSQLYKQFHDAATHKEQTQEVLNSRPLMLVMVGFQAPIPLELYANNVSNGHMRICRPPIRPPAIVSSLVDSAIGAMCISRDCSHITQSFSACRVTIGHGNVLDAKLYFWAQAGFFSVGQLSDLHDHTYARHEESRLVILRRFSSRTFRFFVSVSFPKIPLLTVA